MVNKFWYLQTIVHMVNFGGRLYEVTTLARSQHKTLRIYHVFNKNV